MTFLPMAIKYSEKCLIINPKSRMNAELVLVVFVRSYERNREDEVVDLAMRRYSYRPDSNLAAKPMHIGK
jgi:hypothetical protein